MDLLIAVIIILLLCGLLAGFLAGIFGIGGGVVMVPVMYILLSDLGYEQYAMATSVATSAAVILPTAISGTFHRWKLKEISIRPALILGSGGVLGSLCGSSTSVFIPIQYHVLAFSCFLLFMAFWMAMKQCRHFRRFRIRESDLSYIILGFFVGLAAGLFGIGGGVIITPVLTSLMNVSVHRSVGISLAAMVITACATIISYITLGWEITGLFPYSLGYVNLLFATILVVTSVPAAQAGVLCGMRLSEKRLLALFILMLIILAVRMLISI